MTMNATNNYFAALIGVGTLVLSLYGSETLAETVQPALQFESKIRLGDVSGRIDHIAIDLNRHRIFVAELGNNTVEVVDLNERKVIHVFRGLKEPQGVAYVPSTDTVYVANAGDGSVRIFRADNFEPDGQIDLGDDADNIRVDVASNRVIVGYGNGALAVIDPATRRKVSDMSLKAHPESFQIARSSAQIFVNVPQKREIAVVDLASGKQTASWELRSAENFRHGQCRLLLIGRSTEPMQPSPNRAKSRSSSSLLESCANRRKQH